MTKFFLTWGGVGGVGGLSFLIGRVLHSEIAHHCSKPTCPILSTCGLYATGHLKPQVDVGVGDEDDT